MRSSFQNCDNNYVSQSIGNGYHIQSVFNFNDNYVDDGGTLVVPYFHLYIDKWIQINNHLYKTLPFLTLDLESIEHKKLLSNSIRIPMRSGSILLWNQSLAHGTQPNSSTNPRLAQFCKFFVRGKNNDNNNDYDNDNDNDENNEYWPSEERLIKRAKGLIKSLNQSKVLTIVINDNLQTKLILYRYLFTI